MSLTVPAVSETYLLELVIIPAIVSIISLIFCEQLLFGKKRWNKLTDTAKAISMFIPISAGLYFYFWAFLFQFDLHGAKLLSLYLMPVGFLCSIVLLGASVSGRQLKYSLNLSLFIVSMAAIANSFEFIMTFLAASKGIVVYTSYLADTHLLETGWTYIIGFGLLTPVIFLTIAIFFDPVNRLFYNKSENDLKNEQNNDAKHKLRAYLSFALALVSIIPIGCLALAPIALIVSTVSMIPLREFKIWLLTFVSFILSILSIIILVWWWG